MNYQVFSHKVNKAIRAEHIKYISLLLKLTVLYIYYYYYYHHHHYRRHHFHHRRHHFNYHHNYYYYTLSRTYYLDTDSLCVKFVSYNLQLSYERNFAADG